MKQALPDYDVIIIGLGPTGLVLANLLGRRGWSVAGLERDIDVYFAPRAVHFDDEIMRVFQEAGLHREMCACCEPFQYLELITKPGGKPIFRGKVGNQDKRNGYAGAWWFHQPTVERNLRAGLERFSNVVPFYGAQVTDIAQDESGVTVTATMPDGSRNSLRGRFAIGCDGGRSFTRRAAGLTLHTENFDEPWVVVDTRTISGVKDPSLPVNHFQCCDPAQPVTYVPLAGPYYEWEFMVTDGTSEREATDPEYVRRKLRGFGDFSNLEIMRIAYYRFHALWANKWSNGRIVLAGDSAHQTPPFLGQGMCSGIRDAQNLSWRLDLALKGYDYPALLNDYEQERSGHVQHLIKGAMFLGNLIQTRNRFIAFLRNLLLRPAHWIPAFNKLFFWIANRKRPLQNGFFGTNRPRLTGHLFPQPTLARADGSSIMLDEVIGQSFAVVARQGVIPALPPHLRALAERLPIRLITFGNKPEPGVLADSNGMLEKWFLRAKIDFALIRPDRYVYDAGRADQLNTVLTTFISSLPALKGAEKVAA